MVLGCKGLRVQRSNILIFGRIWAGSVYFGRVWYDFGRIWVGVLPFGRVWVDSVYFWLGRVAGLGGLNGLSRWIGWVGFGAFAGTVNIRKGVVTGKESVRLGWGCGMLTGIGSIRLG